MPQLFRTYATPLITGMFIVSLITGVALFVHTGPAAFRAMHEWLSVVLILPFVLHLWRNWRAMTGYFRHAPMAIALAITVAASALFFLPSSNEGGNDGPPAFRLAAQILTHSATEVAASLGTTPDALVEKLVAGGFTAATPDLPLTQVAEKSGKDSNDLMLVLAAPAG